MSDIFADLKWRGLIHQTTDDAFLPGWLRGGCRTLYAGFDPTADSLHVGSLLPLMTLRRFQRAGHRPIAVVGGATGMIGDPSGKSEERNLLSADALAANVEGLKSQMLRFLDFGGDFVGRISNPSAPSSVTTAEAPLGRIGNPSYDDDNRALLVNNFDWMRDYSYLAFLRDVGKNFPVNVMLAKDSVKNRLERGDAGLSYTEFSYMLLQAYDFVYLNRTYGCELQIGGSDQWGNITAGIDLARRMHGVQLYGMTHPLLLKSDGSKMGKTESGAIWLSAKRTSPYKFYQYWINVEDADAGGCLRFLTELSHEEIESLDQQRQTAPHQRDSQRRLAEELTRLVHGDEGLTRAQRATDVFFGKEIDGLSEAELNDIFADVPSKDLPRGRLEGSSLNIVEALVEAGLAKSKAEARRAVEQGGAYVNNRRIESADTGLSTSHLAGGSVVVLRSGKKRYALLRFVG
jgi:tyrosyl-tRNA synthetase